MLCIFDGIIKSKRTVRYKSISPYRGVIIACSPFKLRYERKNYVGFTTLFLLDFLFSYSASSAL